MVLAGFRPVIIRVSTPIAVILCIFPRIRLPCPYRLRMAIRVLCLHGQGVNASIFQEQISASPSQSETGRIIMPNAMIELVRQMLPQNYQFHFPNGCHACDPAPEVLDFFPPPYLTWYTTPTTSKVLDAHRQVLDLIRDYGQFDVVIGFSQVRRSFSITTATLTPRADPGR
jgi:hypothetical protein